MCMCPKIWIEQVFGVVSYGVVSYEAGRVEGLHTLQLCEVGLLEVFKLYRVHVRVRVVVPVIWTEGRNSIMASAFCCFVQSLVCCLNNEHLDMLLQTKTEMNSSKVYWNTPLNTKAKKHVFKMTWYKKYMFKWLEVNHEKSQTGWLWKFI